MVTCPKCLAEMGDTAKFCRQCGTPLQAGGGEATTWKLPPEAVERPSTAQPTSPVNPVHTAEPLNQTGPAYIPPAAYTGYYTPAPIARVPPAGTGARTPISLGDWLSDGWRIYKQDWFVMSLATLFGGFLSLVTIGILSGPLLMGLFRMAFKTIRGERPELADLFNWEGRFIHAFLATFAFWALYWLTRAFGGEVFAAFIVALCPLLSMVLAFTLPQILERKLDIAQAVNDSVRLVFSRDAVMWWIVGLVFIALTAIGLPACGLGVFVTFPWMVCSAAAAYSRIKAFGFDEGFKTLP